MSVVDPQETARIREAEYRGSGVALFGALGFGALSLLAAAVLGFAVGGVFEQLRIMSINSVFGNWETGTPLAARAWGLPVGIIGLLVGISQYAKWNHRFSGRRDLFAIVGPVTIVLAGLAAGTWAATMMWVQPDAVGVAVDPVFGDDEPWGIGAWVLYSGQWWLPGIFALLTVLSFATRLAAAPRRRRRRALVQHLLDTGMVLSATVIEAPLPDPNASRMIAPFLVKFQDAQGTDRWVTCIAAIAPSDVPAVGARRPLIFDPAAPGDAARIFFSPTGDADAEGFEPVRAAK